MTAVEWLDEQLQDIMSIQYGCVNGVRKVVISLEYYMKFKQEALKLEKEQIKDAFQDGSFTGCGCYDYMREEDADQYYNETYK